MGPVQVSLPVIWGALAAIMFNKLLYLLQAYKFQCKSQAVMFLYDPQAKNGLCVFKEL